MLLNKRILSGLILPVLLFAGAAHAGDRWLHVRVDEHGRHGERVRIQLPLNMIKAILPMVEAEGLRHGHIYLGDDDLDVAQVKAILAAVQEAPDGEYVSVEGDDERVLVAKRGDFLHIRAEERGDWRGEDEVVRVRVPVAVVEALLAGDPDELDVTGAIDALERMGNIELVRVDDGESRVRIWIDERHENLGEYEDDDI
jgi:hypothetical protein